MTPLDWHYYQAFLTQGFIDELWRTLSLEEWATWKQADS